MTEVAPDRVHCSLRWWFAAQDVSHGFNGTHAQQKKSKASIVDAFFFTVANANMVCERISEP